MHWFLWIFLSLLLVMFFYFLSDWLQSRSLGLFRFLNSFTFFFKHICSGSLPNLVSLFSLTLCLLRLQPLHFPVLLLLVILLKSLFLILLPLLSLPFLVQDSLLPILLRLFNSFKLFPLSLLFEFLPLLLLLPLLPSLSLVPIVSRDSFVLLINL